MNDQYRWCIYCEADCWLEPEQQDHGPGCPISTGLWPVSKEDYEIDMCCGMCPHVFEIEDYYMHFDLHSRQVTANTCSGSILEIICIGCAASISILGVKYE